MKNNERRGFTLLDTLIAIGVILILIALLMPAIQASRKAVWDVRCLSHLRQLTQAVSQYEDVHGTYPLYAKTVSRPFGDCLYSIHSALLPFVDQHSVYESLNFSRPLRQPYASSDDDWIEQSTAARTSIATFLCPADGGARTYAGAVNYRGNWGVGPMWSRSAEFPDSNNGAFGSARTRTKSAVIYDGMSRTAAFSERLVGSGMAHGRRDARDVLSAPSDFWEYMRSADRFAALCAAMDQNVEAAGGYEFAGKYWLFTGLTFTLYNHVLPPNSVVMDCQSFNAIPALGSAAARSNHAGHVNICFLDGSARGVSEAVSLPIWRSIGTRDSSESMSAP